MSKKALKGFSNFGVIPVTEDTVGAYVTTGKRTVLVGAQSCSPTDNKDTYTIYGDDTVYDSGTEWKSSSLEVTVAEMSLDQLGEIGGCDFDTEDTALEEGIFDNPPPLALTFSALRLDGGYRLYRYYSAKCTGYKVQHNTRGQNNDAQTYALTFEASPRKFDGKIRGTKDVDQGQPLTWLETIPALPDTEGV